MADTTARVLRLLSLLQAHRMWTGSELQDRLEVSERTLRRDVERLRNLGYPVRSVPGPTGGYQLEAGANMPPLLLDDGEAVAIAVGLRTAAGGTIAGIEDTSMRALAKLEQVLPPQVRKKVNLVQSTMAPMIRPWVTVDGDLLVKIAQACRDNERIRFEYESRQGEASERNVEPHNLVPLNQRWYLVAYDRERDDWRTFRLDRISQPWMTRSRFKPRPIPGGDAAEFVVGSIRSIPTRYAVEALVSADPEALQPRLRGSDVTAEPTSDGRTRLRFNGDSLEWLAFRLTWLGHDFEVIDPPELVDYIDHLWRRLRAGVAKKD